MILLELKLGSSQFSLNWWLFLFVDLPRYIRVNTLVSTVSKVTESLSSDGYKLIETSQIPDQTAGIKWMAVDDHIDNVIALPPKTDLHSHKLVKRGAIILQDKVWDKFCGARFLANIQAPACIVPGKT